jgi:hypothetical protein
VACGERNAEVIGELSRKPAVMGHSTGELLAQMIAGTRLVRRDCREVADTALAFVKRFV